MRTILSMLLSICILVLQQTTVMAEGYGKAFIPSFHSEYASPDALHTFYLHVSNIVDQAVSVKVTFYDNQGNIISGSSNISGNNLHNVDYSPTGYSITFDLYSNATSEVHLKIPYDTQTYSFYGYGKIEWVIGNGNDETDAVIANGTIIKSTKETERRTCALQNILINRGMPF
ncbi:MAG: hypothetical protein MI799_04880 [Desulfobacterales bacterium]|nr:hypothetical protein [Desulfobacterales bacterium]